MNEFKKIFKKVDGFEKLKQYMKAHVLLFTLFQTILVGFSRKALEIVRLSTNYKIYTKIKKKNRRFIEQYVKIHEEDKLEQKRPNVVWIMWLQGIENAPDIVKQCYQSIKHHITDREIVVITEQNYKEYTDFPEYIIDKYENELITRTHFSDLVRVEILARHGGTWIDGTVFCTQNPSECNMSYMLEDDLFVFQNLKPGRDGHVLTISSWFMTACSNHKIILLTRELLFNYWKKNNSLIDYFLIHHMFQIAIETYPEEWNKVVPVSNSIPHILLLRLFERYDEHIWNKTKNMICFHKLSYKFKDEQFKIQNTYYERIFSDLDVG